jgi:hypothetical protein
MVERCATLWIFGGECSYNRRVQHPTVSPRHIEGIAREIHEQTGATPPIDAFALADALGFACKPWGRGGGSIDLRTRVIRYSAAALETTQHGTVCHELFHYALNRGGEDDRDEDACRYGAGALLLPLAPFRADSFRLGFDLEAVRELHPNASAQMVCVRFAQVSPVSTSVWDHGHEKAAYGPAIDHDLASGLVWRVLESGLAVRGEVAAYPVFTGSWRRVVVVDRRAA